MSSKRTNRDWLERFGEYVAAVLRYLAERPDSLPTLDTFRPRDKEGRRFAELLAFERRRIRKTQDLLDRMTDVFENGQYKKVDALSIEIDEVLTELFFIWWELWPGPPRIE